MISHSFTKFSFILLQAVSATEEANNEGNSDLASGDVVGIPESPCLHLIYFVSCFRLHNICK